MKIGILFLALSLLAGCVTETSGGRQTGVDKERQLATLVELGVTYMRNGEYARAKENLNKALEVDPKSALAHDGLALVFQLEQEFKAAEEHFKLAIKFDPAFTRARNNYGAFLFARNRHSEAIDQLKIASDDRYYAGRPAVFENLGVIHLAMGDVAAAETVFERSVALNPDQSRSLLELALIRHDQKRYVESREFYRRYIAAAQPGARSLLLCIKLSRVFSTSNEEASCALALRNIFPSSPEYKQYQELIGQ